MAGKKLTWDDTGKRLYETGTDRGAIYPMTEDGTYGVGEAWNGLISVDSSPSGAEETKLWANNGAYISLRSAEELGLTIGAYTYPKGFAACDGSAEFGSEAGITIGQQTRKKFGFTYRTLVGNDVKNNDFGYKIHLVYGVTASPSERSYSTVNDDPEAIEFSWECSTTPVPVDGFKPTAEIVIDSTQVEPRVLEAIEKYLYGDDSTDPKFPLPDELKEVITTAKRD